MPIIKNSSYKCPPFYYFNEHMETIIPSMIRKVKGLKYDRERIELADGDFLDLDWLKNGTNKCVLISHGLEGNSTRHYVMGTAKYFYQKNWDVCAWNYRSCSDEMNRKLRLYHHGVTDDFQEVLAHIFSQGYDQVGLVGYSMGGSTSLKYLGEQGENVDKRVIASAVFSVPCNLWNSAEQLRKKGNQFYHKRFLRKLKKKVQQKALQFPKDVDITNLDQVNDFEVFDERYTAPLHGFKNAKDFYVTSTSDQFYGNICVPSLLVNAENDPLLGDKCYPYDIAKDHNFLYLEVPKKGGHVGFSIHGDEFTWAERKAYAFIINYSR